VGEKRVVSRKYAVASGVIAVVFVVAMLGTVLYYTSMVNALDLQVDDQQTQIESKDADIGNLTSQISSLQSQINSLQFQINTIQSSGTTLQSQYVALLANYTQLKEQYEILLLRVPPDSGIVIDAIYYKPRYLTPSGVYNVSVRNLGSEDVHVTSLKLFYGNSILGSSASLLVTIPASSTVTIEQFLPFTIGVDIHILRVETLEGYTATSNSLSQG